MNLHQPNCLAKNRRSAFSLDAQKLLSEVVFFTKKYKLDIPCFKDFKVIWKSTQMDFLHQCRLKDEDIDEFYQVLYGVFTDMVLSSHITERATGLYSLYIIYYTQTLEKKKINVDLKAFDKILDLYDYAFNVKNQELIKVIEKLMNEEAFTYGVQTGLKTILLDKYGYPTRMKDKYLLNEELIRELTLKKEDLIDMLDFDNNEKLLQEYAETKRNIQNSIAKQLKEDKTVFEPQSKKLVPESTLKLGKSDVLLFKTLKYKINCSLQYDNPI